MARGLFQVYQDAPTSSNGGGGVVRKRSRKGVTGDNIASSSSSSSFPSSACRDGPASSSCSKGDDVAIGVVARRSNKENVDPLGPKPLRTKKLGPGAGQGIKSPSTCNSSFEIFSDAPMGSKPLPRPSANGVCTGSLRTRTIPELDRPSTPSTATSSTASHRAARRAPRPVPLSSLITKSSVRPDLIDDNSLPTLSLVNKSPAHSARDSGYAPSLPGTSDRDDESDLDGCDKMEEDPTIGANGAEANRRARALTESPLAEVTEAYTGTGAFTNQPASPSPLSTSFVNSRPLLARNRSSPNKSTAVRSKPYAHLSTTLMTTKRVKASTTRPTCVEDDLSRGVRSMRV